MVDFALTERLLVPHVADLIATGCRRVSEVKLDRVYVGSGLLQDDLQWLRARIDEQGPVPEG